jgi:gliding motility-associated-like protein
MKQRLPYDFPYKWMYDTVTFASDTLQPKHIAEDTDSGFVFRADTLRRLDTITVRVSVHAKKPEAYEADNTYNYDLRAQLRYGYAVADNVDSTMNHRQLRGHFSTDRNPYDVGVWMLNPRRLSDLERLNLNYPTDFNEFFILIDAANVAAPHQSYQVGDTMRQIIHVHNMGTAKLEFATVHYPYNTTQLRYIPEAIADVGYRDTAGVGDSVIVWRGISLNARQGADLELAFVTVNKGIVADTASLDSLELRPVAYYLAEDFYARRNNASTDSLVLFSDPVKWGDGRTSSEIMSMFSPNGDGINDYFVIQELLDPRYAANELIIFDRHGDVLLDERPYGQKWDGHGLPDGVYFYRINLWDGSYDGGQQAPIIGSIEIRRKK